MSEESLLFFESLQSHGWTIQDGVICAPHETIWFVLDCDWPLARLWDDMNSRLDRIKRNRDNFLSHGVSEQHWQDQYDDTAELLVYLKDYRSKSE
jgi:hypothetical protein